MSTSPVHLTQLSSIPLAAVRRQANPSQLSRLVPECCGQVWTAVRAQNTKAGRHVAIYWDSAIRLDIGVELLGAFEEQGEVVRSATPAGSVAWATHLGPYGGLGTTHDAIIRWCRANGRPLAGPRWEIYGHWQDAWNAEPSLIQTDVYYLVEPGRG